MAKNCTSDEEGLRAHGNELQEGLIEPASEGKVAAVGPTGRYSGSEIEAERTPALFICFCRYGLKSS